MKRSVRVLAATAFGVMMLLSLAYVPASAAERRITFGRGRTRAVVRGRLDRQGGGGDFVFRARSGQTLTVSLAAGGDTVFILHSPTDENMAGEGGTGTASWTLTETGDYHLSILDRNGVARRFTLTVMIR